jgi:hypothetical protein
MRSYAINDNADYAHHAERNPRRVSKRGVLPKAKLRESLPHCGNDSASLVLTDSIIPSLGSGKGVVARCPDFNRD